MGLVANRGKGDLPPGPSGPALDDTNKGIHSLFFSSSLLHPFIHWTMHSESKAETTYALSGDTDCRLVVLARFIMARRDAEGAASDSHPHRKGGSLSAVAVATAFEADFNAADRRKTLPKPLGYTDASIVVV